MKKTSFQLLLLFCCINSNLLLAQSSEPQLRILVVNCFDPASTSFRKNKKELLSEVADSLRFYLLEMIEKSNTGMGSMVDNKFTDLSGSTDRLDSLRVQQQADFVMAILNVEAEFVKTEVEVERQDDGSKKRTARYDLCTTINYLLAGKNSTYIERKEMVCEFFTERTVMSGLLAAGPDLVGKHKWVFRAARKNAAAYFDYIRSSLQ